MNTVPPSSPSPFPAPLLRTPHRARTQARPHPLSLSMAPGNVPTCSTLPLPADILQMQSVLAVSHPRLHDTGSAWIRGTYSTSCPTSCVAYVSTTSGTRPPHAQLDMDDRRHLRLSTYDGAAELSAPRPARPPHFAAAFDDTRSSRLVTHPPRHDAVDAASIFQRRWLHIASLAARRQRRDGIPRLFSAVFMGYNGD